MDNLIPTLSTGLKLKHAKALNKFTLLFAKSLFTIEFKRHTKWKNIDHMAKLENEDPSEGINQCKFN